MIANDGAGPAHPVVNIVGEKVALGPVCREYLPLYHQWGNDFAANATLGPLRPAAREATEGWYAHVSRGDQEDAVTFTIFERATMRPIGTTNLHGIDPAHGVAAFGIAIGDRTDWGKGYGTETAALMLDYGFTVLGLHNISLAVYSFNERGIRAYTRAGFRVFGRRREAYRLAGHAYDIVFMDCLATGFESPVLRQMLDSVISGPSEP